MKQFLTLSGLFLLAFLFPLSSAENSIDIQKTSTGEIRMKKSISNSAPSSSEELKIEVISSSALESPKIEINPPSETHLAPSTISSPFLPLLQKLSAEPIRITIKNGKAFIHWAGGEQEITLDSQGRFNLQFLPLQ